MSFINYLLSKIISILFTTLIYIIFLITLYITTFNINIVVIYSLLFVPVILMFHLINYLIYNKQYNNFKKLIDNTNELYLISELIEKPNNYIEYMYYDLLKSISRSSIEEINKLEKSNINDKNYINSWIHEIKTPLTSLSLMNSNNYNSKVATEIKRIENYLDDILNYAKVSTLEKSVLIKSINLNELVNNVIVEQMTLLQHANTNIDVNGELTVNSDSRMIMFIIKQLLTNTIKYCVNPNITITLKDNTLIYQDDGIGIPSHDIRRVTEYGFTGDNGKTQSTSSGIGLFIISEYCKKLNIELNIESKVNEYTKFTLNFLNLTKL